jgi:hypothetical protein
MDICYNVRMSFDRQKFIAFIKAKFYDWRGNTDRNWSDFADYIGVPQQTMSFWKNGSLKRVPDQENQKKLIDIYGPEAYAALGIPIPAGSIAYDTLPASLRSRLDAALSELASVILTSGLDPDSPAAVSLSAAILAKYGFKLTDTETDE